MKELRREKFRWSAFSNIDVEMASVFGVCVSDVEAEIASQSARFGYPKSVKHWKRDVRRLRRYLKRRARRIEREWNRLLRTHEVRPKSL